MNNYQLPGNHVIQAQVPIVGNLLYDEVGREVLAIHNERFKGVISIEDTTQYNKNQPVQFSNTPRVLSYNQILRERFPNLHVISPQELLHKDPERGLIYWNATPERDSTYADTDSVVVFPKKQGPNEDLRSIVLSLIGKSKTKIPLIVSGLGLEADNDYGFTFTKTQSTKFTEAPFLEKDQKLIYDPSLGLIVPSEDGIMIYTPSDQSGLRWFCRCGSVVLDVWRDDLLSSDGSGRVQLVQDPQGRAENLEKLV